MSRTSPADGGADRSGVFRQGGQRPARRTSGEGSADLTGTVHRSQPYQQYRSSCRVGLIYCGNPFHRSFRVQSQQVSKGSDARAYGPRVGAGDCALCMVPQPRESRRCLDAGQARSRRPAGGGFLCRDSHVRDSRVALAVPAPPDWTDAISDGVPDDGHRLRRARGAARSRRRRAAPLSTRAAGRADRFGDAGDDCHGACARSDRGTRAAGAVRLGNRRPGDAAASPAARNRGVLGPGRSRGPWTDGRDVGARHPSRAYREPRLYRSAGAAAHNGRSAGRPGPDVQRWFCRGARAPRAGGWRSPGRFRSGWQSQPRRGS